MPTVAPKSNRRNRRRTGRDEYEAMLESHRAQRGCHKQAAEAAGVSYNTARKAYLAGLGPEMPAISEIIEREMAEARSFLAREGVEDRERKEHAIRRHASEGVERRVASARNVNLAQSNTLAALGLSQRLLRRAYALVERFEAAIADPCWEPSPKELVDLLLAISRINRETAGTFVDLAALDVDVIGPAPDPACAPRMTLREAIDKFQAAERTMARIRRQALASGSLELAR